MVFVDVVTIFCWQHQHYTRMYIVHISCNFIPISDTIHNQRFPSNDFHTYRSQFEYCVLSIRLRYILFLFFSFFFFVNFDVWEYYTWFMSYFVPELYWISIEILNWCFMPQAREHFLILKSNKLRRRVHHQKKKKSMQDGFDRNWRGEERGWK